MAPNKQEIRNWQNNAVKDLLVNHNRLIIDKTRGFHPEVMLNAAVNFVKGNLTNLTLVARTLQNVSGHYEGEPQDILSEAAKKAIFYDWLGHNVLGKGLSEFIIQETINFNKKNKKQETKKVASNINSKIRHSFNEHKLDKSIRDSAIKNIFPVGHYEGAQWNDSEFVYSNAGMLFANDVGIDPYTITKNESFELGQAIYLGLQQGLVPSAWVKYFKLFAIIQYAKDNRSEVETLLQPMTKEKYIIEEKAISNLFSNLNTHNLGNNPFYKFKKLLENYKTRSQLSDAIRGNRCPYTTQTQHLNGYNFCATDRQVNHPPYHSLDLYTDYGFPIADATESFNKQNNDIANAFSSVDSLLITNAWGEFTESEKLFIFTAEVQRVNAYFSALDTIRKHPVVKNQHLQANLRVSLSINVDLFSATKGTEQRLYALQSNNGKYELQRVDRNIDDYYRLLSKSDNRPLFDKDFKLVVTPQEKEIKKSRNTQIESLIETLVSEHQISFTKQLHDQGYDKTGLEKFKDFALSLVPLYTCVTELQAGNDREGVPFCMLDVISFIPFIGQAGSLGVRVAQRVGLGSQMAVRHMLAQASLKAALKQGGAGFIYYAAVPASEVLISSKNLASLGIQALRSLDPGFELMSIVSKAGVKQFVKLGDYMAGSLPNLQASLSKINQKVNSLPESLAPARSAHFPGLEIEIPHATLTPFFRSDGAVIRSTGKTYNGEPVYRQANKKTGEFLEQQYICQSTVGNRVKRGAHLSCIECTDPPIIQKYPDDIEEIFDEMIKTKAFGSSGPSATNWQENNKKTEGYAIYQKVDENLTTTDKSYILQYTQDPDEFNVNLKKTMILN